MIPSVDTVAVLRLFDRQVRRNAAFGDPDVHVERDPRLVLAYGDAGPHAWSAVLWSDLDEANADAEVARGIARLRELGRDVEWKLYAHDLPRDLSRRLREAGLAAGEEEAVLVAELAGLRDEPAPPPGVELAVVAGAEDVEAFVSLHEHVFGGAHDAVGRALGAALGQETPSMLGVVARAGGKPVSAARIEFNLTSDFASLWGGGTLPEWRGRGVYRATVALRARLARERGYRYLQVDALPTSRPILERLGFVQLTTTTPYTSHG